MTSTTRLAVTFGCVLVLMVCAAHSQASRSQSEETSFALVRDGKAACTIVTARNPTPASRLAALELQYHVLKATGAEIPIRTDAKKVTGPRILVGDSAATRPLGVDLSDFAPQEYLIAFRPDMVILMGRDWEDTEANRAEFGRPMCCGDTLEDTRHKLDYWKTVGYPERSEGEMELPGIYDYQGTCYATYDFLERFCGVRWYGAPENAVIIPSRKTLTVSGTDIRRSPALKYRDALWSGNWPFMKGQWGPVTQPEIHLFWRRLRLGGEKWAGNHTFHPRTIQTKLTAPEYQAQGPGHGTQLCYTHPKLVAEVAQMARDFFDGKENPPAGWKAVGDYFAIVPDDNSKFCECEQCQALLESGKDMRTGQFSSGEVSNYFFSFVNAVAREVAKTHPDKYVATLAYWNYAFAPRGFDIEPNVSIAPCLHTCYYAVQEDMRDNDLQLYTEWIEKAEAPLFLWNYYHHPMEAALINKFKCFPNVMVHETARTMRKFIDDGIRGIFICGEQDMLEGYVIAKIWDDPTRDVDALIDEFFDLYFGAAAKPMKTFYLQLEKIACDRENYPRPFYRKNGIDWEGVAWTHLGTEKRMQRLGALIEEAEARARTALEKQRVAQWKDAFWKWMQDGRAEYLAKQAEADENASR